MSVKYVNFTKTKYFNLNSHTFGGRGRKKVSNTVPLEVLVSLNPYYPIKKKKKNIYSTGGHSRSSALHTGCLGT